MSRQFLARVMLVLSVSGAMSSRASCQNVQVAPGSIDSASFRVQRDSGTATVTARVIPVQIQFPNKRSAIEYVLTVYDPKSRAFWWDDRLPLDLASGRLLPLNSAMFLTDSKFVFFWNGWVSGGYIMILESSDHASSIKEGEEHVMRVLEERRADIAVGKFLREYKRVEFSSLNRDFLFKKNVANLVGPTLRAVSRVGSKWHIVEDGPNGDSATIVLNDKYEVQSVKVQPTR